MLKLGKGTGGGKDSPSDYMSDAFLKQNYGNNLRCSVNVLQNQQEGSRMQL
jgi:hypothetical protein